MLVYMLSVGFALLALGDGGATDVVTGSSLSVVAGGALVDLEGMLYCVPESATPRSLSMTHVATSFPISLLVVLHSLVLVQSDMLDS